METTDGMVKFKNLAGALICLEKVAIPEDYRAGSIMEQKNGKCDVRPVIEAIKALKEWKDLFPNIKFWFHMKAKTGKHSSFVPKILAVADADDQDFYIKKSMADLVQRFNMDDVIIGDSKSLFVTITTLHGNWEHRLRKTEQRMPDMFSLDICRL